jgi:hypothetical protein
MTVWHCIRKMGVRLEFWIEAGFFVKKGDSSLTPISRSGYNRTILHEYVYVANWEAMQAAITVEYIGRNYVI